MTKTERAQAGRKASPWNSKPHCTGQQATNAFAHYSRRDHAITPTDKTEGKSE
jgi:hypothetical protein